MLISVHMPKAAGSSFQATLAAHYGEALLLRYADQPLHRSTWSRNLDAGRGCLKNRGATLDSGGTRCIHGHFLPLHYRLAKPSSPLLFVTWLRDPVQRLLSHYYYWQRSYQPGQSGPLHQRMMEEKWSLEEFALCRELRNIYGIFLWGFPLERFDFIGITEDYAAELARFGRDILKAPVTSAERNRNPDQGEEDYAIDKSLRRKIEAAHGTDIALYQRALTMRDEKTSA
ncbi:sulfotransferase family 2 domain-containing protein [Congregibacter litoralis]|uniref:Sulfotransferase family n=1 Tax=Congregibacter litoralis KT71 TaxID=314285 RepID=A4AE65_9GAMM|nr:sulfotransferase family 2 domain-containing protein [Congregibacter litoralis]EAQ95710.1 Sulfotransferase family [Congregibacter litoralis KT71]